MANLTAKQAIPKGRFRVKIDDIAQDISFQNCEGLGIEIDISKYNDGTDQEAALKLGKTSYDDVTLSFGESAASVQSLWAWFFQCAEASQNGGLVGEDLQKQIDIICENDAGQTVMTWRNIGCYPKRMEPDSRDANSADTAIGKLVIARTSAKPIFGAAAG
jgi:phage tail-like protein